MTKNVELVVQQIHGLSAAEQAELALALDAEDWSDLIVSEARFREYREAGKQGATIDEAFASISTS
jgi:hypothetical protein